MNVPAIVIIPARNEAATIADIVRQVQALGYPVLVVDDASTDGTAKLARDAGARVSSLPHWLGNMRSIRHGLRLALREPYAYFITMDADGQHRPEDIPALLEAAGERGGVILASCPARASRLRHAAWAWFRFLSRLKTKDMTTGFKVYSRQAAKLLARSRYLHVHYQDVPVLLLLHHSGIRVSEVPVSMRQRAAGISHIFFSWKVVIRYMLYTSILCCAYRLRIWP